MSTPLASFLSSAMAGGDDRQPITATRLAAMLTESGHRVSVQAVSYWLNGGGIRDSLRKPVAEALGISLEALCLACAGVPHEPGEGSAADPASGGP